MIDFLLDPVVLAVLSLFLVCAGFTIAWCMAAADADRELARALDDRRSSSMGDLADEMSWDWKRAA